VHNSTNTSNKLSRNITKTDRCIEVEKTIAILAYITVKIWCSLRGLQQHPCALYGL